MAIGRGAGMAHGMHGAGGRHGMHGACGCGAPFGFHRRFVTHEERQRHLEEYLEALRQEAKAVEELLEELRHKDSGSQPQTQGA